MRETASTSTCLARTESVFALANGHIGLRANLDEGEPFGLPGHLPELVLRAAAAPVRGGRLRLPGVGPDARERHERQDHPPARRRRAVRRPLRRAARARARARPARRRAPPLGRVALAGRRGACASARRGSSRSSSAPRPRSSTRSSRSTAPLRVVVQSELVANEPAPRAEPDPRAAAVLESPLASEEFFDHDAARRARPLDAGEQAAPGRGDGPRRRRAGGDGRRRRERARRRPRDGRRRPRARRAAARRQVPRLRRGRASARCRPCATRSSPRSPRRGTPAGTACSPSQRAYLDEFWERADVELDGDAELQQAVRFALFHVLQAGARAEQRAIAAKGLTGPGYDGHTFWDTERFVLPVLTYTAPRAAADALRWRHATLDLARERARQLGLEGAAFPWRTIRGQECSGYWPAGTAAFHIGADIADAVVRYQAGDRTTRRSSARSGSSCSSRRRGSGARSATTTRRAASASTASPAPTSTARSPTTTSTRT